MTSRRVFRAAVVALALPVAVSAQTAARIVVSPMPAQVVAGETLQLRAQAVDRDGKPVSDARIRFQQTDFPFQGTVDSTGLVRAGAVSTIPVVVSAIQPGVKPIIARIDVSVIAGPAASITIAPAPRVSCQDRRCWRRRRSSRNRATCGVTRSRGPALRLP